MGKILKCEGSGCANEFYVTPNRTTGKRRAKFCSYSCRSLVNSVRHGHNKPGKRTRTYQAWADMIQRCRTELGRNFKNYKAGGITVCKRWLRFENFLADMGECPPGLTLERKDNKKGYSPDNCYWATPKQQMRNTQWNHLLTFRRRTQCLSAWAEEMSIRESAVRWRVANGWPVELALTVPVRLGNRLANLLRAVVR